MPKDKDNPIQQRYDDTFNGLRLAEAEGTAESDATGQKTESTDDIKNAEETPQGEWANNVTGDSKKPTGFKGMFKKKSATIAIILTLLGFGTIGIGGVAGPSLLLVHIKETLSERFSDSSAPLKLRTDRMLLSRFKETKNAFAESTDGKCNIKCKFGTVNETMLNNFKAKGFDVEVEEGKGLMKGRYTIKSMTFPDGTVVKNGADFDKALKDPGKAVAFTKVFNSKTAYFLNSKFGKFLSEKFKLDKVSKLKADLADKTKSAKERVVASMRKALNLPDVDAKLPKGANPLDIIDADPRFEKVSGSLNGLRQVSQKAQSSFGLICTAYDTTRGISFASKAAKIAAIVSFAMIFLNAADQIKAGEADPDVISVLGDQLTQTDASGKSATDSLGYRAAAYGDMGTLTKDEQQYTASASDDFFSSTSQYLSMLALGGVITTVAAKNICKVAKNSIIDGVTAVAEACPEELIAAAGLLVETAGIGSLGAIAVCGGKVLAKSILQDIAIGKATGYALGALTAAIVAGNMPKLDENTRGIAVGDAITTGAAQILGGSSAGYGLKAGSKAEIKQFAIDTAPIKQQQAEIARYEARETPFDIYNKYSFLGSIVDTVDIASMYNTSSPVGYLGSILSIVPKSFGSLSTNVAAEATTVADLYGKCADKTMSSLGVDADAFCNPAYVMSNKEMTVDYSSAVDYMIRNKYIDPDTGEVSTSGGWTIDVLAGSINKTANPYDLYLKNCSGRSEPIGETASSVSDDSYEWNVGMQCQVNNEMMNNFRTYTMDKAISDSMDEDLSKVTGSGDSSLDMTQVSNPVDGAATICVDAGHPPTGAPGEPEYNLKTAKALQTELQNRGYKVIMTRTDSGDVSIAARPKKCLDGKANLLYSIHGENDGVAKNHPFTIYMKDGRSQSAKSKSYAKTIQDAITSSLAGSHGMKGEQGICMEGSCTAVKNLGVFSGADAGGLPAVLSEVVRSNDDGTSAIDDPAYLKKLVTGIANGIQKIFPLPAPPKVAYA